MLVPAQESARSIYQYKIMSHPCTVPAEDIDTQRMITDGLMGVRICQLLDQNKVIWGTVTSI
jgi:hypothetical protein